MTCFPHKQQSVKSITSARPAFKEMRNIFFPIDEDFAICMGNPDTMKHFPHDAKYVIRPIRNDLT